jgi:hypothetical protein
MPAKWLDAYFGIFEIPGAGDGFLMSKQLPSQCAVFWDEDEAKVHNDEHFAALRDLLAQISVAPDS